MNKRYIDFVPADKRKRAATARSKAARSTATAQASTAARAKPTVTTKRSTATPAKPTTVAHPAPTTQSTSVRPARVAKPATATSYNSTAKPSTPVRKNISRAEINPIRGKTAEMSVEEMFAERTRPAGVSSGLNTPKFGVIEDYHPKFVQTEVNKRPLGAKKAPAQTETSRRSLRGEKSLAPSHPTPRAKAPRTPARPIRAPKPHFVNAGMVEKRPLSGGVHPSHNAVSMSPFGARSSTGVRNVATSITEANSKAIKGLSGVADTDNKSTKSKTKKTEKDRPVRIITMPERDSKAGVVIAVILTIILGAAAGTVAFLILPK